MSYQLVVQYIIKAFVKKVNHNNSMFHDMRRIKGNYWRLNPGTSGVATPGHPRACAHVKFAGARVKIMWKAKVKDQVLVCAIAKFHVDVK